MPVVYFVQEANDVLIFKNANGFPGYTKWPQNYC